MGPISEKPFTRPVNGSPAYAGECVRHKGNWYRLSHWSSCYADHDVVAESVVHGQVHAQLSDPAVERMPGAVRVGTPKERVE